MSDQTYRMQSAISRACDRNDEAIAIIDGIDPNGEWSLLVAAYDALIIARDWLQDAANATYQEEE